MLARGVASTAEAQEAMLAEGLALWATGKHAEALARIRPALAGLDAVVRRAFDKVYVPLGITPG